MGMKRLPPHSTWWRRVAPHMKEKRSSEWVARCLETLGHEVIVADPNFAPMYAHRNRKIKPGECTRPRRGVCARRLPPGPSPVGSDDQFLGEVWVNERR
jgi:hypothetical protein